VSSGAKIALTEVRTGVTIAMSTTLMVAIDVVMITILVV
jgi:hypothetical protein